MGQALAELCKFQNIPFELRDDTESVDFSQYEVIIPSPGIPGTHPIYQTGKVISELDFAYQFVPAWFQIIAVTGTDGKSTTSWIMYTILEKEYFGKKSVYLSGNFDIPFSATVREILEKKEKRGVIVIEVSSFMSHAIGKKSLTPAFSPDYTIFTNFESDHLNWHIDLQEYLDAKMNLVLHTKKCSILNAQIQNRSHDFGLSIQAPTNVRWFQDTPDPSFRDRTNGEDIFISGRRKYRLSETHFIGRHNAMNILACAIVANEMRICSKRVKTYLSEIDGLSHRIEFVTQKKWITYIDDSKSTSCQSLMAALSGFYLLKTILIAGGSDKWDPFLHLEDSFSGLKFAVLIGATREILAKKCELAGVDFIFADTMSQAVKIASEQAMPWDTVLLSPGCASFGLFRDYLDRAEQFREAIKKLPE